MYVEKTALTENPDVKAFVEFFRKEGNALVEEVGFVGVE
jgi:ABC-type phosphate transport system substrate-binding protein